jgi:hypothetical protein
MGIRLDSLCPTLHARMDGVMGYLIELDPLPILIRWPQPEPETSAPPAEPPPVIQPEFDLNLETRLTLELSD